MKDLKYHKQQVKQHQIRNRFNEWAEQQLNIISERIKKASNERYNKIIATLQKP